MYFALLFSITLATGLILHGIASLVSLLTWRILRHRLDTVSSFNSAALLLCLRFFPLVLSLFLLAAFVVPAFLAYEPRSTIEPLSFTLLSLAGVTSIGLSGSISRCIAAILQSRRVMGHWLFESRLLGGQTQPQVYVSRTAPPLIAAVGLWRTRIVVSDSIIAALSADELQAALAHEAAHMGNLDIAKKMLLQLAPSFLPGIDLLRPVTAHWTRVCELLADEQSVADLPGASLHLAAALVKVVRLAQDCNLPVLSAALVEPDGSLLSRRIRRLLEISERPRVTVRDSIFDKRKVFLAGCCIALMLILVYPHALSATHELLESFVRG